MLPQVTGFTIEPLKPRLRDESSRRQPHHHQEDVDSLVNAVEGAISIYDSSRFHAMRAAAMDTDVSWEGPAAEWETALRDMVTASPDDGDKVMDVNASNSTGDSGDGQL